MFDGVHAAQAHARAAEGRRMSTTYASATEEAVERLAWANAMLVTVPDSRIRIGRFPVTAWLGAACAAIWIYDLGVALLGIGAAVVRF